MLHERGGGSAPRRFFSLLPRSRRGIINLPRAALWYIASPALFRETTVPKVNGRNVRIRARQRRSSESGKYSFHDYRQEMGVASNQVGRARRSYRRNTWHLNEVASLRPSRSNLHNRIHLLSTRRHVTAVRRSRQVSIMRVRSRTRSSLSPFHRLRRKGASRNSERKCLPFVAVQQPGRRDISVHAKKGSKGRRTELSTGEPARRDRQEKEERTGEARIDPIKYSRS